MDSQIGHLHSHYRVLGDHAVAAETGARLDRVARDNLPAALGAALERALGDDTAVYVVRDVTVGLALRLTQSAADRGIAQRWGEAMARKVMQTITHRDEEPSHGVVVRFADQADYVGHFIGDLLESRADRWYYAPLLRKHYGGLEATVESVLRAHAEHLPLILAHLQHSGHLEPMLRRLEPSVLRGLLAELRGQPVLGEGAFQPLYAAAVRLGDRLGFWQSPPPANVLNAYVSTGPSVPDWRDPASLALGVLAILRFLVEQGYLRPHPGRTVRLDAGLTPSTAAQDPALIDQGWLDREWLERLDEALAELDWLDIVRLRNELIPWLRNEFAKRGPHAVPSVERPGPADLSGKGVAGEEAFQPLYAAALRLGEGLGLWPSPPPANALATYMGHGPAIPDWRDPAALALAVLAILRFLTEQGYVRHQPGLAEHSEESLSAPAGGVGAQWRDRLDEALAGLDWLDTARLRQGLSGWLAIEPTEHSTAELHSQATAGEQAWQPLYAVAVRLGVQIGFWQSPPPAIALNAFASGGRAVPDWRDPAGLALGVLAILRFLAEQGHMHHQPGLAANTAAASPTQAEGAAAQHLDREWLARLDEALAELDWLDAARLRNGLLAWLGNDRAESNSQPETLPRRPGLAEPTPRQRLLLEHLLAGVRGGQLRLDAGAPESPANALRWYAKLIGDYPDWAGDALAPEVIARLLAVWAAVQSAESHAHEDRERRDLRGPRGPEDSDAVLKAGRAEPVVATARFYQLLGNMGEPGLVVVEALMGRSRGQLSGGAHRTAVANRTHSAAVGTWGAAVVTECAGVALLLRTLVDIRLPALTARLGYPLAGEAADVSLQSLLLALCLRWSGLAATGDAPIDPGLVCFAGLGLPEERIITSTAALRAALAGTTAAQHAELQSAWLPVLEGQRVLAPDYFHLYRVEGGNDRSLLIMGDSAGLVWPLGRVVGPGVGAAGLLEEWRTLWADATGSLPQQVIVDDALTGELLDGYPVTPAREAGGEAGAIHAAGRERLLAALAALDAGGLGLSECDLTLSLIAAGILRLWARWLHRFDESSAPYLLDRFIRRPGQIEVRDSELVVEMERGPLDMVLDMAGYLAPVDRLPWLGGRTIYFRLRG